MEITATQHGRTTVIAVAGSVDALTAGDVSRALSAELGSGHAHIVADLGRVDFVSSAGLRAILAALKESRQQGGDLRLAAAQPGVGHVLSLSGFAGILQSFPTVDEAVASFGSGSI